MPVALLLAIALQDSGAVSPEPPSERISVGGSAAMVLVMPCFLPTIRVSIPFNQTLGVDADLGPALFWGDRGVGQIPEGWAVDTQLRWSRSDRKSDGTGRYWLFGGSYAQGRRVRHGVVVRNYGYRNLQIGYGWDQIVKGFRTGVEIKVSPVGDGEGHARLFVVWGRRR